LVLDFDSCVQASSSSSDLKATGEVSLETLPIFLFDGSNDGSQ